ncbi:MAG: hypothetical protein JWN69_1803 [Alphaproteobacteria bacterium]|nr:hypothetical protein [Alphaproteobacteria bacterium]
MLFRSCLALVIAVSSYPAPAQITDIFAMPLRPGANARPAASGAAALPAASAAAIRGSTRGSKARARYSSSLGALANASEATLRGAKESNVYEQAAPAVVLVITEAGLGSGVVVTADGKIVTNAHVVEGFDKVGVVFKPKVEGTKLTDADVVMAKVVHRDEVADLALLQVPNLPANAKSLALGSLSSIPVGADVHAIGHPIGEAWTYTRGIVSQVRRGYDWISQDGVEHNATVVQTQTPINPGNSGGPLLNDAIEVVGINSFGSEGEGLNFAISADDVRSFLARATDRTARRPRTLGAARDAATKNCETKLLDTERSEDPPGEKKWLDFTCDGEIDAMMLVPDDPKQPQFFVIDNDGNGKADEIIVDVDRDGTANYSAYDTDEDGKMDLAGYYRPGEDDPYRYARLSNDDVLPGLAQR